MTYHRLTKEAQQRTHDEILALPALPEDRLCALLGQAAFLGNLDVDPALWPRVSPSELGALVAEILRARGAPVVLRTGSSLGLPEWRAIGEQQAKRYGVHDTVDRAPDWPRGERQT